MSAAEPLPHYLSHIKDAHAGQGWRLQWDHGSAELQPLGGMLGPVTLRLGHGREFEAMHVAPWHGMTAVDRLPGIMRRLRGEWPCVPFGRTDLPHDLPPGWRTHAADDRHDHGYAANHHWHCVDASAQRVHLAIDYPLLSAVQRVERIVTAVPHAPALDITLIVHARRAARMPLGLHPTFRLPPTPGRVRIALGEHEGIHSYPATAPGGISRLLADTCSPALERMAGIDGPLDLSHLPLAGPCEELLQVRAPAASGAVAPLRLHYLDYDACVGLWWDTAQLPDLMLWISNGGRVNFPWMSRHLAIGAEPVNSLFDLGRVASAPPGHPLADRLGVQLTPGQPWQTRYRIAAWHDAKPRSTEPTSY
jgi:hypothetical protein